MSPATLTTKSLVSFSSIALEELMDKVELPTPYGDKDIFTGENDVINSSL